MTSSLFSNKSWKSFNLFPEITSALNTMEYKRPTKIQADCMISAIRDFKNIIGASETGSGKTMAFGIPIIQNILTIYKKKKPKITKETKNLNVNSIKHQKGLKSVILSPTRELALQISRKLKKLAANTDLKIITVTGGFYEEKQSRLLSKGVDIIVATPGRFLYFLNNKNEFLMNLSELKSIAFDEADRLISGGQYNEVEKIMEFFFEKIKSNKKLPQIFIFSATLLNVSNKSEEKIIQPLLNKISEINKKSITIDLTTKNKVNSNIKENIFKCDLNEKDTFVYFFTKKYEGKTLLFVNSIFSLKRLRSILTLLKIDTNVLHSKMKQKQRLKNLERFTNSKNKSCVLVCTDVAARGIDIPNITHIIHYHPPRSLEIYIHRCGRTARAKSKGFAISLITDEEKISFQSILKETKQKDFPKKFKVDRSEFLLTKQTVKWAQKIEKLFLQPKRKDLMKRFFENRTKLSELKKENGIGSLGMDKEAELKIHLKHLNKLLNSTTEQIKEKEKRKKVFDIGKNHIGSVIVDKKGFLKVSKKKKVPTATLR